MIPRDPTALMVDDLPDLCTSGCHQFLCRMSLLTPGTEPISRVGMRQKWVCDISQVYHKGSRAVLILFEEMQVFLGLK